MDASGNRREETCVFPAAGGENSCVVRCASRPLYRRQQGRFSLATMSQSKKKHTKEFADEPPAKSPLQSTMDAAEKPDAYRSKIRWLRRRKHLTLAGLAKRCGCTTGLLSKIESGKSNPSLAILNKIAAALGISLADLMAGESKATCHDMAPAAESDAQWTPTAKGYEFQLLAGRRTEKLMQPVLVRARKGRIRKGAMNHPGEEWIHMLKGRMRYRVGSAEYVLNPGDSLYFDAEEDHDLEPLNDGVEYLAVFTGRMHST